MRGLDPPYVAEAEGFVGLGEVAGGVVEVVVELIGTLACASGWCVLAYASGWCVGDLAGTEFVESALERFGVVNSEFLFDFEHGGVWVSGGGRGLAPHDVLLNPFRVRPAKSLV